MKLRQLAAGTLQTAAIATSGKKVLTDLREAQLAFDFLRFRTAAQLKMTERSGGHFRPIPVCSMPATEMKCKISQECCQMKPFLILNWGATWGQLSLSWPTYATELSQTLSLNCIFPR